MHIVPSCSPHLNSDIQLQMLFGGKKCILWYEKIVLHHFQAIYLILKKTLNVFYQSHFFSFLKLAYFLLFCFRLGKAQGFLLTIHSGIISGGFQELYIILKMNSSLSCARQTTYPLSYISSLLTSFLL